MPFRHSATYCLALCAATVCSASSGQSSSSTSAATAVQKARALYYTPVDSGLQAFHCEVNFDWKDFMQKATNQPVPDDDARLAYLKSIKLAVDDDLHTGGQLSWTAPTTAPEGSEDSVGKIRGGMQQIWAGFFQSWNGFYTGDLVTLDAKAAVEQTATGYHVGVHTGSALAEELLDDKLVLKTVHVATPTLDSTLAPSFTQSPKGLLVNQIASSYKQPPTAQPTDVTMRINYAAVGTFQLPSELIVNAGPANFDFHLANCTVKTQITPR